MGDLADQLTPQHNYRLDINAVEGRHYGEVACKEFWESVLRVMPHRSDIASIAFDNPPTPRGYID